MSTKSRLPSVNELPDTYQEAHGKQIEDAVDESLKDDLRLLGLEYKRENRQEYNVELIAARAGHVRADRALGHYMKALERVLISLQNASVAINRARLVVAPLRRLRFLRPVETVFAALETALAAIDVVRNDAKIDDTNFVD